MESTSVVIEGMTLDEFQDMLTVASHCLNTGTGSLPMLRTDLFNAIIDRNPTEPRAAVAKYIAEVVRERSFEFDDSDGEDLTDPTDEEFRQIEHSKELNLDQYAYDPDESRMDQVYGHEHGRVASKASWWGRGRSRLASATPVSSLAELLKIGGKEKIK